jgi:hypothetical protein
MRRSKRRQQAVALYDTNFGENDWAAPQPRGAAQSLARAQRPPRLGDVLAAGSIAVGILATIAWVGFLGWLAFSLLAS